MRIIVNGQPEHPERDATIASLIAKHDLQPLRVAVEVNEQLVPRRDFEKTRLTPGDRVEIVTLVGGG